MARPSASWTSLRDVDENSAFYQQVHAIVTTSNFDHLMSIAVERRQTPNLHCKISDEFTTGREHVIFELAFSDGTFWIARVPHHAVDETNMLCEAATMRLVRERTSIPIPQIYVVEHTTDQPFNHPYMLMEYIHGSPLTDPLCKAVPAKHRAKAAKQFASILFELQHLTFPRIGRWNGEVIGMPWHHTPGPLESSLDYYYNQRQGDNRAALAMNHDADWTTACWMLKLAPSYFLVEDKVRGPFPLCHFDLHYGNLLFDNDYNIVGVIDWSSTQAAPFEQLAITPEMITYPFQSKEENQNALNFRNLVIDALRSLEGEKPALSSFMASVNYDIAFRATSYSPRHTLFAGKLVAELVYGDKLTWDQLKALYGSRPVI